MQVEWPSSETELDRLVLTHVATFDTDTGATMNLSVAGSSLIAAGQDDKCHVYA